MFAAAVVKPRPYALDPGDLAVFFTITNRSAAPAMPECIITAFSPGETYSGTDTLTHIGRIGAGKTVAMTAEVAIHPRGAKNVTVVKVSCFRPRI